MAMAEKRVVLHTTMGDITIRLYDDMPVTAGNFEKLVRSGFYDGTVFHRVIDGFMIQGGDPTGTGSGGPGYTIPDEFVKGHSNVRGTVAMANTGRPNTGGSQFFINLVDNTYLDWDDPRTPSAHPVFGEVVGGMDVVDRIGKVKTDPADRPKVAVRITKAEVVER
jgi:peptidylprolyl isomerase